MHVLLREKNDIIINLMDCLSCHRWQLVFFYHQTTFFILQFHNSVITYRVIGIKGKLVEEKVVPIRIIFVYQKQMIYTI